MNYPDFTITWGVQGQVRVLILTGANGELPEDLLEMARDAFQDGLCFEVRVKLWPCRYNPSGRLWGRMREEIRHLIHLERPWFWMLGVPGGGRFPKHWRFIRSRGWRDPSYKEHLAWADVTVYNSTTLWREVTSPLIHVANRSRRWLYNPAGDKATVVGDSLTLRYAAYKLGRQRARERGIPIWDRKADSSTLILKEYCSL